MKDFEIKVEVLKYGQVAPYKDSVYEYRIKTTLPEFDVKSFCVKFLKPATHEVESGCFNGSCSFPFGLENYYKFSKTGDDSYYYIVCSPYTG
jgi:hypothetical protein